MRKVASAGDQDSLAESAWWLGNNDEAIQGVRRRRAERRLDGRSASPTGTMRSAGCGAFTVTSPALHSGSQLTPRTRTAAAVDGQPLEAYVGGQSGRVHRRLPLDARKRRALGLRFDGADRALVDVEQVVGAAVTGRHDATRGRRRPRRRTGWCPCGPGLPAGFSQLPADEHASALLGVQLLLPLAHLSTSGNGALLSSAMRPVACRAWRQPSSPTLQALLRSGRLVRPA